jgi:hypothetical protein
MVCLNTGNRISLIINYLLIMPSLKTTSWKQPYHLQHFFFYSYPRFILVRSFSFLRRETVLMSFSQIYVNIFSTPSPVFADTE